MDEYLIHYGVLGMKWGVRKKKPSSGSKKPKNLDEEIQQRNKKVKRILAISAGVTLAAATAYVAYKHHDYITDKFIKSGTTVQNINRSDKPDIDPSKPFYAAITKADKKKYQGIYGNELMMRTATGSVNKTTLKVGNKPIKIASNKNAKDIFEKTFKGSNDIEDLKKMITYNVDTPRYMNKVNKAKKSLDSGIIDKNVYETFNAALWAKDDNSKALKNKFYNALREKGYGAIQDINDKKYSGYKSQNPVIIFGGKDQSVFSSKETIELGKKIVAKSFTKEATKLQASNKSKNFALAFGAIPVLGVANEINNNTYVKNYRDEHPNTKMSYNQILKTRA